MADVEVSRDGAVLTITLNRPDVLNALNLSVHQGLIAALETARDPSIRAVLVTGAGRGFCVGQDLQEFRQGPRDVAEHLRATYHRTVRAIRALEKPVIAAVNGPAAGAGLSLALVCDVRIASDAASFVPGFIAIGLVPDSGGTWFAQRILGAARAFEWLTTGRRLDAEEARTMGLVSEVVPAAEFEERMHEVGRYFAAMPTRAVWETKRLLDHAETSTLEDQLEHEAAAQNRMTRTPDFREGVAAFLEKREAVFAGRTPPTHPIRLVVADDLQRWRLTVGLRFLLALPWLLVAELWGIAVLFVSVVAWFATLINGTMPPRLHAWTSRYLRYSTHVNAFVFLAADPFPSFRGLPGTYPVDLAIAGPEPQPRWKTALRIPLAIPAAIFLYALGIAMEVVAVVAWFVALALGRLPKGLVEFMAYYLRFQAQTSAYLLLLTSTYPALSGD